ncbi:hypothetical protein R1flu_020364 [Riccia fluitans]|uniref:Pentatricopeptide repeat-containing protein n=1 Tax=Riccia fluitans TaxID=41844 RepID=A0ABD1ZNG0_9MARC
MLISSGRYSSVAHRALFLRTVAAFHSSSLREFERDGQVSINKSASNRNASSDESQPRASTEAPTAAVTGGRFSRPLGFAEGSVKHPSNYKKERVPPRPQRISRSDEDRANVKQLPNFIFKDDDDAEDNIMHEEGSSSDAPHEMSRRSSRVEQIHPSERIETETYSQEFSDRGYAFSDRGELRRGNGRTGEKQHEDVRRPTNDDVSRPETGDKRDISEFQRRSSTPRAKESNYTERWRNRETGGEGYPAEREDRFDRGSKRPDRSDERHYGYRFRRDGPEIGTFRSFDDGPSLADERTAGYKQYKRTRPDNDPGSRDNEFNRSRRVRGASDLARDSDDEFEGREFEDSSPRSAGFFRRQEGEKRWQYAVRKKQQMAGWSRGKVKKSSQDSAFVDEEELGCEPWGDEEEWRSKKLAWLCREFPGLKPRGVVTILNEQRRWIESQDVKFIVEQLLKMNQFLRAHRVLKWEMQQPWYVYDFKLNTQVANALGENGKLSRTRDLYDLMIQNQKVPELTTYVLLINCYIEEGTNEALTRASYLFNQMSQMGGYEPPASLRFRLFKALAQKNLTFIEQADQIFEGIKAAGLVASEEIYNQLVLLHGTRGNQKRVDSLVQEMKELGLKVGDDVYSALINACIKEGDVAKAEEVFSDLKKVWERPIPSVYAALIKLYGKAGMPQKAFQVFEELKLSGVSININVYEPIIEVTTAAGDRERAEKLVEEAQRRDLPSMQGCYSSLIRMYSELGELEAVEKSFQDMQSKGQHPTIATYNAVLGAYVRQGLVEKAEELYDRLRSVKKISPNPKTYELLIKLYGDLGDSDKLNTVFKEMSEKKMDVPNGQAADILKDAVGPKQIQALKNSKLKLNKNQREVLAGVLLGGARIETHDRNRTYEVHFEQDPDDQVRSTLLQHLYSKLSDWCEETPKQRLADDPRNSSQTKKVVAFQTISHGSFRFFAHQYRPDGKPKIPRLIHRWLSPQTLAYWYMYGGRRCSQTGSIILNASAYTSKELSLVVDALKAKTIDCEKRQTKNDLFLIVEGKSASWLWKLMQPHIIPGVQDFLKPEDKGYVDPVLGALWKSVGRILRCSMIPNGVQFMKVAHSERTPSQRLASFCLFHCVKLTSPADGDALGTKLVVLDGLQY